MSIEMPDALLASMWEQTDWKQAEALLSGLQRQLTLAAYAHDEKRIVDLQKRIVRTPEIKQLAVRHVSSGKSGPGIDHIKWTTPAEKMRAALSLTSKDYHAQPLKIILLHSKTTGKERRVGVPTFYDRAMQVLYDYTLSPVTEAWAERKSFAFRTGRSMLDVNAYIFDAIKGHNAPELVVVGDVKACYASIQHSWLLAHVPMDKSVLREFLNCGHVFAGELFPAEDTGISLGANLSPHLGNFVLDGMQKAIYTFLYGKNYSNDIDFANGNLIRFCDDVFITVRTQEDGEKVIAALTAFLDERGLSLSSEKTRIQNIRDGVTFLSRTYIKKGDLVRIQPSNQAVDRFIGELHEFILTHRKSQRNLIESLNSRLRGWASYHRFSDATDAFRRVDAAVQASLLEAAIQRHPRMPQKKIINKYWYKLSADNYVYALPDQKEIRVMKLSDVMIVNHRKIATNKNPYLHEEYFEERDHTLAIRNVTGPFRSIWERQHGRCYYCGRPILQDQPRTVVQLQLSRPLSYSNSAYVHSICKPYELSVRYISDDVDGLNSFDLLELLNDIKENVEKPQGQRGKHDIEPNWKHIKLKNYFAKQNKASFSLTFEEIERIDGRPLPPTALKSTSFWYPRNNCNMIAEAWITEGYTAKKIDMDNRSISFKRLKEGLSHIKLPSWLDSKVPDDARYEIETHFDYIEKKYGL